MAGREHILFSFMSCMTFTKKILNVDLFSIHISNGFVFLLFFFFRFLALIPLTSYSYPALVCLFACLLACLLALFVCLFVRLFGCTFVHWSFRSFVGWLVGCCCLGAFFVLFCFVLFFVFLLLFFLGGGLFCFALMYCRFLFN